MNFSLSNGVKQRLLYFGAVLLVVVVLTAVQLPYCPRFKQLNVDSGVFAYAGQQILTGELPYRDFWDHKPPAIFYLNALAIFVVGQTPWAIWWLGFVWISCTSLVFFGVMQKLTGLGPATLATLIFVVTLHHPDYYQRGNFPEVYSLLLQVLTIGAIDRYVSSRRDRWIIVIGVLTAVSFLFKHICVGLGLACLGVILYLDIQQRVIRKAIWHVLLFGIAASAPITLVVFYWVIQGAFRELWDAVVTYNLLYSQMHLFFKSLYSTIRMLALPQPMATIFTISMVSLAVFLYQNWLRKFHSKSRNTTNTEGDQVFTTMEERLSF